MAVYIPNARQQFCDANGTPLAAGSVGMYVVGTTTPSNTWQDAAATTLNANPIALDSGGFATIYGSGQYRQIVKDQAGNVIWDRVVSPPGLFIQNGAGAVARTFQDKLRETVSVLDFGADPTGVADSTTAFTNAAVSGGLIAVPQGSYLLNSAPSLGAAVFRYDKGVTLSGTGASGTWAVSGTASTQYVQTTPASTDLATEFIRREASYSGGTIGFDTVALRVQTDVSANVANYEWNGLFQLNNSATAGQNAALYAQANKMAMGPTWAFVSQVNDSTGGDTGGCVGHEIDVLANGTDPANNRVGIDIVGGRYGGAGALAEIGYGIRISPQAFNTANAKFKVGIQGNGLFNTGIDFASAAISGNAFQSPGYSVNGAGTIVSLTAVTVAALPAAGTAGRRAFVSDATATTFGSTVAGSGTNHVPVYDNGTNWCVG